ncbi:MAG: toxin-activating lysine-acyltransferase [Oceanospirillaceae bacterium]|jgi:hemolysin-activating ACP:hemolysin acyltransferase|nr:toxin-activating lysine-acyltransferase [Oceanospirillaceae bacterium]
MLTQINSPLIPLTQFSKKAQQTVPASTQIPLFQTVGILLSLYALHWQHDSQTVGQWLSRVMPFLNHQQARLFLTKDKEPYGFASWVEVPEGVHHQLLKEATWEQVEPQLSQLLDSTRQHNGCVDHNESTYLWFIDLITPFSHALAAMQDLRQQLRTHNSAWAINPIWLKRTLFGGAGKP